MDGDVLAVADPVVDAEVAALERVEHHPVAHASDGVDGERADLVGAASCCRLCACPASRVSPRSRRRLEGRERTYLVALVRADVVFAAGTLVEPEPLHICRPGLATTRPVW